MIYRYIILTCLIVLSLGVANAHKPSPFQAFVDKYGSAHIYTRILEDKEIGFELNTKMGKSKQLFYASALGFVDLVSEFLPLASAEDVKEGFFIAAHMGQINVLELYVKMGVDPDKIVNEGVEESSNALHVAAENGQSEVLRYLVSQGMDINSKTKKGADALVICILGNYINCVKTVLDLEFDIENSGWPGLTPFDLAKKIENEEILNALAGPGPSIEEFNALKEENRVLKQKKHRVRKAIKNKCVPFSRVPFSRSVWLSLGIFVAVFSLLLFLIKLYLFRNLDYEPRNYLSDEKEISIIKTLGMLCVNLTIFTLWIYSSIDFLNNM